MRDPARHYPTHASDNVRRVLSYRALIASMRPSCRDASVRERTRQAIVLK